MLLIYIKKAKRTPVLKLKRVKNTVRLIYEGVVHEGNTLSVAGVYASLIGDIVSLLEVISAVVDLVSTLKICKLPFHIYHIVLYCSML